MLAWIVTAWRPPIYGRGPSGWSWPFAVYARYDSGHFLRIAQFGYFSRGLRDPNAAFFPGYPLLGRWTSHLAAGFGHVTNVERLATFALLAWGGAAIACVLLWRWIECNAGPAAATVGVAALMFGPYGFFFMADYSEGLFLTFALAAWLAGRNGRWMQAGALAGVAALFRIDGLFLLVGLAIMYAIEARRNGKALARGDALALSGPLLAVGGFFAWLWVKTGHWDAWTRAEKLGWERTTMWPWRTLANSVLRFTRHDTTAPVHFQAGLELLFAALYLVVLIALARRRLWPEVGFVGCAAGALLTSSFYQSVPRSFLVAFPVFLLVGELVRGLRKWYALVPGAVVSAVLVVINASLFVRGYIAG